VFPAPATSAATNTAANTAANTVIETGLSGRPIPVEQDGPRPRLGRTMLIQLAEPFIRTESQ
jgi:hypothetical protein